jgi:hypothetical protein
LLTSSEEALQMSFKLGWSILEVFTHVFLGKLDNRILRKEMSVGLNNLRQQLL